MLPLELFKSKVDRRLHPLRHRNGSNVTAFSEEIGYGPVFLALLQMREFQIGQFAPPKSTAKQYREDGAIPLSFECVRWGKLPEAASLVGREPVSKPHMTVFSSTCRAEESAAAITFALSPGNAHDAPEGRELLRDLGSFLGMPLIMDRAYEGHETHQFVLALDMISLISPKSNRVDPRRHDRAQYKKRNEI